MGWADSIEHFTPYQLILGTFTILYALRHLDDLLGLGGMPHFALRLDKLKADLTAPEPLARLVGPSCSRPTACH